DRARRPGVDDRAGRRLRSGLHRLPDGPAHRPGRAGRRPRGRQHGGASPQHVDQPVLHDVVDVFEHALDGPDSNELLGAADHRLSEHRPGQDGRTDRQPGHDRDDRATDDETRGPAV
ncbi:MAG: hypothetical protein AVDCRST_MAG32-2573, partial [uncultured Nocardioides sp.]